MADAPSHPESHQRRNRGIPLTTAGVTVTAISVTGTDVVCNITGAIATDNAVFVSQSADTEITFDLVDETGQGIQYDTTNPFGSQNNMCPKKGSKPKPPCSVGTPPPTADCFTMVIAPTNGRAVSYYRLNFTNGLSCDPIIIHD